MCIKKYLTMLFFVFVLLGQAFAQIEIDSAGNLYHFTLTSPSSESYILEYKKSIDQGNIFGKSQTIRTSTIEIEDFQVKVDRNKFFLSYITEGSLFFSYSTDFGNNFSDPELIVNGTKKHALSINDNQVTLAWAKDNKIMVTSSEVEFISFLEPFIIEVTGETAASPTLLADDQHTHLSFLTFDPNQNTNRIMYTKVDNLELKEIYHNYDEISNLNFIQSDSSLIIYWQKKYQMRNESYLSTSLNRGETFNSPIILPIEKPLLGIIVKQEKPYFISFENQLIFEQLRIDLPLVPEILSVSGNQINYNYIGTLPILCKFDISKNESFPYNNFSRIEQLITKEVNSLALPKSLEDGSYYLRAYMSDGLNISPFSKIIQIKIDNTPPQVTSLETTQRMGKISIKGEIDESPAWVTINNQAVSFESETEFPLISGKNEFLILVSDEAGNYNTVTHEVFYNAASPEITVIKPNNNDWFKPGSSILVEATLYDHQGDIEDESDARVMINGELIEESLSYDSEDQTLFGFVTLPSEMIDGIHAGTISISDQQNNKGTIDFSINIDTSSPVVNLNKDKMYANNDNNISIPIQDNGAGVDVDGTVILFSGISYEGDISFEADQLIVNSAPPMSEGIYEVLVFSRDLVGNTGEVVALSIIIDSTPPNLELVGTYEASTTSDQLLLQAKIDDTNPVNVELLNNNNTVHSLLIQESNFSHKIPLQSGNNNIVINATDQSGNTTSKNIQIFASATSSSGLISSCTNGPNPFSPEKKLTGAYSTHGNGMVFSYNLNQTADIKIRIFDIVGNLIWAKDITNASSGVTAWDGTDQFGKIKSNGIYPYIFSATAGGKREIKRSKIIIYR
jgi:hypothetical protein